VASPRSGDDDLPSPRSTFLLPMSRLLGRSTLCRTIRLEILSGVHSDTFGQAACKNGSAKSLHSSLVHVPSLDNPLTSCACLLIDPPLTRGYARKRMKTGPSRNQWQPREKSSEQHDFPVRVRGRELASSKLHITLESAEPQGSYRFRCP
jgi:hypothetical protein